MALATFSVRGENREKFEQNVEQSLRSVAFSKFVEYAARLQKIDRSINSRNIMRTLREYSHDNTPIGRLTAKKSEYALTVVDLGRLVRFERIGRAPIDEYTRIDVTNVHDESTLVLARMKFVPHAERLQRLADDGFTTTSHAVLTALKPALPLLNLLSKCPIVISKKQVFSDGEGGDPAQRKTKASSVEEREGDELIVGGVEELNSDDDKVEDIGDYDLTDDFIAKDDDDDDDDDDDLSSDGSLSNDTSSDDFGGGGKSSDSDDDESSEQPTVVAKRRRTISSDEEDSSEAPRASVLPKDRFGNYLPYESVLEKRFPLDDKMPLVRLFEAYDECVVKQGGVIFLANGSTVVPNHTYTVDGQVESALGKYESTTSLLKQYSEKFDADKISLNMVTSSLWPTKTKYYADATNHADAIMRCVFGNNAVRIADAVERIDTDQWPPRERTAARMYADGELTFDTLVRTLTPNMPEAAKQVVARHQQAAAARIRWRWDHAAELGTEFHLRCELFFEEQITVDQLRTLAAKSSEIATDQFVAWLYEWFDKEGLVPFRCELALVHAESNTTGSIDFLALNRQTGHLTMIDWKHAEDISAEAFAGRRCRPPLEHLPDCKFTTYGMQQNVYRAIFHAAQTQYRIDRMYLLQCHPTLERYRLLSVPDWSLEARTVMDLRARQLQKQP